MEYYEEGKYLERNWVLSFEMNIILLYWGKSGASKEIRLRS